MSRASGTRVDRFEVVAELGRGGMGVVYQARDTASGQHVALKLLTRVSPQRLLRFVREGEISASLRHPGIVAVHAAGASDGQAWLAFELVEGARTFDEATRSLPLARRLMLLRDAARALGHAHRSGVVHRDVKPDNLLVGADYRVRVADFGVALGCDLERLTMSGALIGTPLYMAPELLHGRRDEVGPQVDVWAVGVMLYDTACGRPPFRATTLAALLDEVTAPPPRPRDVAPDVARSLEAVILRALSIDPAERHADGEALALDLDRFLDGEEIAPPRPPARRRAWLVAAVLALACAVPAGMHLLAPVPTPDRPGVVEPVARTSERATTTPESGAAAAIVTASRGHADALLAEADAALLGGRTRDALALYTEVLELDPLAERAWSNRAGIHLRLKQPRAAIDDATRAIELAPEQFEAWQTRGAAHMVAGEPELALRDMSKAVELAPGDPSCLLYRAKVRLRLGDREGARADLDAAVRHDSSDVAALFERAKVRQDLGDLAGARSDLDRAMDAAGPRKDLLINSSVLRVRSDDYAGAELDLNAALALGSTDELYMRRARVRYRLGRIPEALRDADQSIALSPSGDNYGVRAGIKLGAKDFDGALTDATEALRRGSKDPMTHAHRGLALGSLNRSAEAVPDLTAAIDAGVSDLQLRQCRGFGLEELKRYDEGAADFDHVLERNPGDFMSRYGRGRVRRLLGRFEGAVADLTLAIEATPENGSIYLERGVSYEKLGREAEAIADLREVVRLLPARHPHRVEAERRLTKFDR